MKLFDAVMNSTHLPRDSAPVRLLRSLVLCSSSTFSHYAQIALPCRDSVTRSAVALPGTVAFFLHTVWKIALFLLSFPCAWLHSRDLLLDLSRLLDLTLRPLRSRLVMPPGTLATLEAGTCAGSRARNFSTFPFHYGTVSVRSFFFFAVWCHPSLN